jgi:hypothetical protein
MFIIKNYRGPRDKFKLQTTHCTEKVMRFFVAQFLGPQHFIGWFWCNKGHKNGPEVHCVTNEGVIYIYNAKTYKLITCLIGRPEQVKRYFDATGLPVSRNVLERARQHEKLGYNNL